MLFSQGGNHDSAGHRVTDPFSAPPAGPTGLEPSTFGVYSRRPNVGMIGARQRSRSRRGTCILLKIKMPKRGMNSIADGIHMTRDRIHPIPAWAESRLQDNEFDPRSI
jgi:hypothetical protein